MSGTVPPTVSSPALDVMEIYSSGSGESEVEEEEDWIRRSCTIPNRAIKPLPVRAGMLSKASVSKAPTQVHHPWDAPKLAHSAELPYRFSNQLYSMSQEMSHLDAELAFLD
ncbi:hypothetical protein BDR03DRAFT_1014986 [Suillus americanus]|nr:hypothetical protein BDR03DRAFT_1014986 [Suillus americanus]